MRHLGSILLGVQALSSVVAGTSLAAKTPTETTVLIETRVGSERIEQQGAAAGFIDGWGEHLITGVPLVHLIEQQLSRSAGEGGGLLARIEEATAQVRQLKLAIHGEWKSIIDLLKPIHDEFDEYRLVLAQDPETRNRAVNATMLLALAYHGRGSDEQATELVTEIVRDFPEQQITIETTRGPEFFKFYEGILNAWRKRDRVPFQVEVGQSAGCAIYVNESKIGVSPRAETKVVPGRYRVFVDCGTRRSRVREFEVSTGTSEKIDVALDSALHTSKDRVVLVFRDENDREQNEVRYASEIGKKLNAARVVTLGLAIDKGSNTPQLVGRVIDVDAAVPVASHLLKVPAGAPPAASKARELGVRLRTKQESGGDSAAERDRVLLGRTIRALKAGDKTGAAQIAAGGTPLDFSSRSDFAWQILGLAYCSVGNADGATRAWQHLSEIQSFEAKRAVQQACLDNSVALPSVPSLLALAEDDMKVARYTSARRAAIATAVRIGPRGNQSYDEHLVPPQAWRIVGIASCAMGLGEGGTQSLGHLDIAARAQVVEACREQHIELPFVPLATASAQQLLSEERFEFMMGDFHGGARFGSKAAEKGSKDATPILAAAYCLDRDKRAEDVWKRLTDSDTSRGDVAALCDLNKAHQGEAAPARQVGEIWSQLINYTALPSFYDRSKAQMEVAKKARAAALASGDSAVAWFVAGYSACNAREPELAHEGWTQLHDRPLLRSMVEFTCEHYGIPLSGSSAMSGAR